MEELKGQVHELRKDKQETGHRLSELELEIKTMRIVFGAQLQALGGGGGHGVMNGGQLSMAQQVAASLRNSPLSNSHSESLIMDQQQHQRQAESTPLSSRSQRNQLNIKYGVLNEHQESPSEVVLSGGKESSEAQEKELLEKLVQKYKYGNASATKGATNNSITTNTTNGNGGGGGGAGGEDENQVVMQMEKDTFDLRRELQDAVAGKKSAEQRILT